MDIKRKIKIASAYADITQAEIARQLDSSPQVFNRRLKVGKFTMDEWEQIAEAMGAKLEFNFVFPDGTRV